MPTFAKQLQSTAQALMDAAQQIGQPATPVTAVLLRGGGLRLYQHCPEAEEWPLDAVIRESGGETGYRVTRGPQGANVEARRGQSPLHLVIGCDAGCDGSASMSPPRRLAHELLSRHS